ncbi:hypothetical protein FCK90_06980 [Kocuria coralli]|uniref:histidine kinase n=1 Tax=Kocuria coralli TaxID=1461025 RepID=A0A5J5KY26_9MICC|nr:ATP-binding protein [Kocuria coralli]KAA9394554.1 hypothetical protein FCK90_06980 [Kocuria coralli]
MERARGHHWARIIVPCTIGGAAVSWSLTLPWLQPEFSLGVAERILMAVAGAAIIVTAGRTGPHGALRAATWWLGAFVLAYPALLGVGAAYPGNAIAALVGGAGHIPPLLLLQLVPVLAATAAVGRRHRRWEITVILAASVTTLCTVLGGLDAPGAGGFAIAGAVLWSGSAGIAPAATWSAVHSCGGVRRRRAVLSALAAIVPVVLLVWCVALGVLGQGFGLGDDWSVSTLMTGFSVSTLLCAVLSLGAATGPEDTWLLRTRTLIGVLDGLLAALALLVGSLTALASSTMAVPPSLSVGVGAAMTILAAAGWWQARAWTRRVVDPASTLRRELSAMGDAAAGHHRQVTLHVLRGYARDPSLLVRYRAEATWTDEEREDGGPDAPTEIVLAMDGNGQSCVLASVTLPRAARRLVSLGDCSAVLHPALLEAQAEQASRRAEAAAETERRRLSQNLHDGLQGRLLGLALNLQLSGRDLDDPAARILIDDAVGSLRSIVEDVRSLGGGRIPDALATGGLEAALRVLLAPIVSMVDLDLPGTRLAPAVEETAYFIIGEAVTNALKHSGAHHIGVCVDSAVEGAVAVTVRDDGGGGADPRAGSGLRTLSERVMAAGGAFVVRDGTDGGTVVEAVLPCAS